MLVYLSKTVLNFHIILLILSWLVFLPIVGAHLIQFFFNGTEFVALNLEKNSFYISFVNLNSFYHELQPIVTVYFKYCDEELM